MIVVALIVIALAVFYYYNTRTFKYWQERGIKHDKPVLLFGNNFDNYVMRSSVTEVAVDLYWKYPNEKVIGFFRAARPELVIRDPVIAKRIMTQDFSHFYPRGLNPHKKVIEPLMNNLFFADGDLWKLLRQRMTPAFSTGKLKAMFPLVCERAERLRGTLTSASKDESRIVDARDVMARYTTDFIGSVGFGLDSDSLGDENSAFRKLGYDIFNVTLPEFIIQVLKDVFVEACKHLHYTYKTEKELMRLVDEIKKQRNYKPSGRNDFIDLLLELQQKGTIVGESIERIKPDGTPEPASLDLDSELFAAQVFVFFAAGFETSSSATSFTLHQLAFHPEIQIKVQNEIDRVLAKHNNKLSYDAIKEMTYLECAFKEGMRIFPSLGFLIRECARTYTIPEIDVTIDPGIGIIIPVQAYHTDPQYFQDPEEFRPERFLPDEFDGQDKKCIYLPFGVGPRACIGERLGLMQSIAGLAAILSRFTVEPAPTSVRKPMVEPKSQLVQSIRGGLPLIFRKRPVNEIGAH